jgi:hypothetical protein
MSNPQTPKPRPPAPAGPKFPLQPWLARTGKGGQS